jgi:CRP-like cAMP-binding protein
MLRHRPSPKSERLRAVELFADCTRTELSEIAALGDELDVTDGRTLVHEGKTGREFFVLLSGEAVVTQDGRELATLAAGNFFGEMALLDSRPRSATVTMRTDGAVLVVSPGGFATLIDRHPQVARKVLAEISRRIRRVEAA